MERAEADPQRQIDRCMSIRYRYNDNIIFACIIIIYISYRKSAVMRACWKNKKNMKIKTGGGGGGYHYYYYLIPSHMHGIIYKY